MISDKTKLEFGKSSVSLRKFATTDVEGIVSLLNRVFNPEFSTDWWKWKYTDNPNGFWGEEGDIWVAEDQNKIIGHYAVIPYKMKYYSKILTVAQSVDTATDVDYRGMGIFSKLANHVYATARKRYCFVFGFPSPLSYNGFIKFGWTDVSPNSTFEKICDFDTFVKETIGDNIIGRFTKPFLKANTRLANFSANFSSKKIKDEIVQIEELSKFNDDLNIFWNSARKGLNVVLERSATFLNWRFSSCFGNYQIFIARSVANSNIVGYIVLRKRPKSLDIIDLVTLPKQGNAALKLIELAINIGKKEGVCRIRCNFPKWHENAILLRQAGFVTGLSISRPIARLTNKVLNSPVLYDFGCGIQLPTANNWFCTDADIDCT